MMNICTDNRFEIIARAKADLLEGTNIETDEAEMAVLDNILFRCWQMGWLDRYDHKTEPQICDTCRYYNSNIPCGSTPSACKKADKFAEEFVDGLKKLKPKDEPRIDCRDCKQWEYSGWLGYGCKRQRYDNKGCKFEPKDEQTDCAWNHG